MAVRNFVKADVNVAVEIGNPDDESFQTGFDSVDSLPESPDGHLLMIEDNRPSDICFASLTDSDAEGTGIYFKPIDNDTRYLNVQRSAAEDGDVNWAITRKNRNEHNNR